MDRACDAHFARVKFNEWGVFVPGEAMPPKDLRVKVTRRGGRVAYVVVCKALRYGKQFKDKGWFCTIVKPALKHKREDQDMDTAAPQTYTRTPEIHEQSLIVEALENERDINKRIMVASVGIIRWRTNAIVCAARHHGLSLAVEREGDKLADMIAQAQREQDAERGKQDKGFARLMLDHSLRIDPYDLAACTVAEHYAHEFARDKMPTPEGDQRTPIPAALVLTKRWDLLDVLAQHTLQIEPHVKSPQVQAAMEVGQHYWAEIKNAMLTERRTLMVNAIDVGEIITASIASDAVYRGFS